MVMVRNTRWKKDTILLVDVDLFFSGLVGLIDSRLVYIIGVEEYG
jgi:hypothetical protein